MKHHKNRSKHRRQRFEAVIGKWRLQNIGAGSKLVKQVSFVNALGAAAIIGIGTSMAWAKEDPTLMPEVVVTGQQEQSGSYKPGGLSSLKYSGVLLDIPQTVTVIPKVVMQEQGATTLREVVRNVPGISIQAGEGGVPAGDNLSIRGFSARTDIFIDGVRDFGGYARDSFNFGQVEVIKGPSSAYGGRGSTGGSVNLVSKTPENEKLYDATAGLGSDRYQRYTMDVNQPIKDSVFEGTSFRLNAMYHDADVAGRDVVHASRWGVAPSLAFGLETPTRVTLSYFRLEQNNIPDYGIPWVPDTNVPLSAYKNQPAPVDWGNFYGLKDRDYEKIATDIVTLKAEHDVKETLSLRNQLRFGNTYRDSIITAPRFASPSNTDITRTDWKSRDQEDTILANQTDVTLKFNTAHLNHTFVPGIELAQEKDVSYTRVKTGIDSPTTDLYVPHWNDPYLEAIKRNGAQTNSTANSVGIYAFDTVKLSDQWEVNGGVRWDYFDLDYLSMPAPGTGVSTHLERIDRMLSWRSGVVYKPQANGSLYAAYGTSVNPSAEGLALSTTATAANNINADPEESRSYEVGTKWDLLNERLQVNAAVFRTDKTNARTEDPTDSTDTIVLQGQQRVEGFEIGLAGNITRDWKAFGAYTYLTSEILKSKNAMEVGKELSNTPENTFSLWTTYQLPRNFEVGTGLKYVDTRFNSNINNRQAPSYFIADAMAAYQVNKELTMRLNIYNLGDAEYIDSVGGGHSIPGGGRSLTVTSEWKF